jgi:hypothetical protein
MRKDRSKLQLQGGHNMKIHAAALSLALVLGSAGIAVAQTDDSPEARAKAVDRYFQVVSLKDMLTDMVIEVAKQLPPEDREIFKALILKYVRLEVVEAAAKQSLTKHLTVAEINVFTEFLQRPEGKSGISKMKYYYADILPVVQFEMDRAMKEMQSAQPQK